jgi:hypothetical protein
MKEVKEFEDIDDNLLTVPEQRAKRTAEVAEQKEDEFKKQETALGSWKRLPLGDKIESVD